MCERSSDSTTPPDLFGFADQPCGYRVTEAGLKALAEYEERHGDSVVEEVALPYEVAEALETEAWQERRKEQRKEARERGRRPTSDGLRQMARKPADSRHSDDRRVAQRRRL